MAGIARCEERRWLLPAPFIEPGSTWNNGYIASFNAELHDELLNREIFYPLRVAQVLLEQWGRHYNTVRPHCSFASALVP